MGMKQIETGDQDKRDGNQDFENAERVSWDRHVYASRSFGKLERHRTSILAADEKRRERRSAKRHKIQDVKEV